MPVVAVLPLKAPAGADPRLIELGEDLADDIMEQLSVVRCWPDDSYERSVSPTSDFAATAKAERALWLDSLTRADLPICATAEPLKAYRIEPLPECEAGRVRQPLAKPRPG